MVNRCEIHRKQVFSIAFDEAFGSRRVGEGGRQDGGPGRGARLLRAHEGERRRDRPITPRLRH